jgi:hypothetical protein
MKLRKIAGVALTLVVVAASVAVATGAVVNKTGTTTVTPDANGTAKAKCPNGLAPKPTGLSVDRGEYTSPVKLTASGRTASATLFNKSTDERTITVLARCAKIKGLKVRTITEDVSNSGHVENVTASCKRDERLLFGGFQLPAGGNVYLAKLVKQGQTDWTVGALSFRSGTDVTAYAYCSNNAPETVTRSRSFTVPDGGTKSATVSCPAGTRAVAGGYKSEVTVNDEFGILRESRLAGSGWKIAVRDDNEAHLPPDVTAYAYCA